MSEENPHAGQGAVVVDIGGDVGALVVVMPAAMIGLEVEIVPTGTADEQAHRMHRGNAREASHDHGRHEHSRVHDHSHHDHDHDHDHGGVLPPHVEVVPRPVPSGAVIPSLVYGSLLAGTYDLYVRPDGPVRLTAEVRGGEVTEATWPAS